jgi:hypothetical protein
VFQSSTRLAFISSPPFPNPVQDERTKVVCEHPLKTIADAKLEPVKTSRNTVQDANEHRFGREIIETSLQTFNLPFSGL